MLLKRIWMVTLRTAMLGILPTIRRLDAFVYSMLLLGFFIIVEYGVMSSSSSLIFRIAATLVGLCAISAGILAYLNPDDLEKGSDPVPGGIILLVIGTLAFVVVVIINMIMLTPL